VKIAWQEAHLPHLISTLTSWISHAEKDVINLSLGVLVNLCYKNLPAVYTLMRSMDSKQFLRTILKLQNDDINTRVQVLFFGYYLNIGSRSDFCRYSTVIQRSRSNLQLGPD
jgi:hypothetical protein